MIDPKDKQIQELEGQLNTLKQVAFSGPKDYENIIIPNLKQNIKMLKTNLQEASKDYHFYDEIIGQQENELKELQEALIQRDSDLMHLHMLEEGRVIPEEGRKQIARQYLKEEFPNLDW
jgi:hypothetical protein